MAAGRDIDDLPKNEANYTALTPMWFLERAATVHPTRTSVVHGSLRYTWLDTYRRCRRLASALSSRSIGLGSTVLLLLYHFLSCLLLSFCLVARKWKKQGKKILKKRKDEQHQKRDALLLLFLLERCFIKDALLKMLHN